LVAPSRVKDEIAKEFAVLAEDPDVQIGREYEHASTSVATSQPDVV
jgi:hypothetical protein